MKAKAKKPQKKKLVQAQIRMSEDLREQIRAYQERLGKETGLEVTFAMATRKLIEKGLILS